MAIAIALHLLAAVIWVGGMFFAYMALRPAAASLLEPPLRLPLWSQVELVCPCWSLVQNSPHLDSLKKVAK